MTEDPGGAAPQPSLHEDADPAAGERVPWAWLAAFAVLQFVLALAIAPHVMGEGDAAEFTLTLAVAGVPHPPGYPLYTLLGHAFVSAVHEFGAGWAFAAVLWSAAGAALATFLTAALCDALIAPHVRLGRPARIALVGAAAIAIATDPVFVRVATQAEVHSLHAAWVAGSALAALALWRARARLTIAHALLFGALLGAGLAHHLTAVFFAMPLAVLVALRARREEQRTSVFLPALAAGVAVSLSSYLFITWRATHPASFQWPALEPGVAGLFAHASGAIYRGFVGGFHPSDAEAHLLAIGVLPVALPGVLALLASAWRSRRAPDGPVLFALLAAVVLQLAFTLRYGVKDPTAYFLPVLVISLAVLVRVAAGVLAVRAHRFAVAAMAALLMAAIGFAWAAPEFAHARRITEVDRSVRSAFASLPFERGIVLWESDAYVRLLAHQQLEGVHRQLLVIDPAMLTWTPYRRSVTTTLGFDPLAGMLLESDADLAGVGANIARRTALPVVDFGSWWATARAQGQ